MSLSYLPAFLANCCLRFGTFLDARVRPLLPHLFLGILFARGRRTATSWFRAAGITDDFRRAYRTIYAVGRKVSSLAFTIFLGALRPRLVNQSRLVCAIDDTPTARYGPCVEGAGIHRNPTPGPSPTPWLYGHLWVTLAWLGPHPAWGILALPLLAALYIRRKDIPKLPKHYHWEFRTKITLAVELLHWLVEQARVLGKTIWVAVDGGYAKKEFLRAARDEGVTVVGRLRKDAALRTLPPTERPKGKRGPLPTYGKGCISLAKRAGQQRGWQRVNCQQYGKQVRKRLKTFLATWVPAGGVIRVVLVRERQGWLTWFCTDPEATAADILAVAADRGAIEQTFCAVKEVWGAAQQQLRNVYANVGAWHLNLWAYTLVELWAWDEAEAALVDRSAAPWDREPRRPSHADKRRALQRYMLQQQLAAVMGPGAEVGEIRGFVEQLLRLVA